MAQPDERIESKSSAPGQYTFRIKSFTFLSEVIQKSSGGGNYESPIFESGGHKWKLSLYPNGDKKLGGDGHISLYLVLADAKSHFYGSEVSIKFKMFMWDQIRDEFLTVHDGKIRKFHTLKKEWGFTRLISLGTFKDCNNGYLVDDCCAFGVEILVVLPAAVQVQSLSFVRRPIKGTFTWKVDDFSKLTKDSYYSDPFTVEDSQWKMEMYPNGLDLFLWPHDDAGCHDGLNVYVEYTLRIRDRLNGKHLEVNCVRLFCDSNGYGCPEFICLKDLKDRTRGFLVDDSLILETTINVISKVSDIKPESGSA